MPSDAEISRAKEYLTLRLRAERVIVSELDAALLLAARRIVSISRKYGIPPESFRFSADPGLQSEVRAVLAQLRDTLYDSARTIDSFTDGDGGETFVAPALSARDNGKTPRERLALYTSRWGYEVEAAIAAAGLENVTDTQTVIDGIRDHLSRPYENPMIARHLGEGEAVRLDRIPHYGKGRPVASETALAVLLTTVVAKGWMQNWARINAGKRGYYVYRGSSYPCDICDAQVGFLHAPEDIDGQPPYHPHCCCYTVYTNRI